MTAGLYCTSANPTQAPLLNIVTLNLLVIVAAIVGDTVGYWIGAKAGPKIFTREQSLLFSRKHLLRTKDVLRASRRQDDHHRPLPPFVRTFAPVVAGVGKMSYRRFVSFNVFGGMGWVLSMTLLGFTLGKVYPPITKQIDKVIIVIIFVSLLPGAISYLLNRKKNPAPPHARLTDGEPRRTWPEADRQIREQTGVAGEARGVRQGGRKAPPGAAGGVSQEGPAADARGVRGAPAAAVGKRFEARARPAGEAGSERGHLLLRPPDRLGLPLPGRREVALLDRDPGRAAGRHRRARRRRAGRGRLGRAVRTRAARARVAHGTPALLWVDVPLDGTGATDFKALLKAKLAGG